MKLHTSDDEYVEMINLFNEICQDCENTQNYCPIDANNETLPESEHVDCPLWMFWYKHEEELNDCQIISN